MFKILYILQHKVCNIVEVNQYGNYLLYLAVKFFSSGKLFLLYVNIGNTSAFFLNKLILQLIL